MLSKQLDKERWREEILTYVCNSDSWLYQWTNIVMCIEWIKATRCHKYKKNFNIICVLSRIFFFQKFKLKPLFAKKHFFCKKNFFCEKMNFPCPLYMSGKIEIYQAYAINTTPILVSIWNVEFCQKTFKSNSCIMRYHRQFCHGLQLPILPTSNLIHFEYGLYEWMSIVK